MLVFSDIESLALAHLVGRVKSNNPKNESAKTQKTTKNNKFKKTLVAIEFKISGLNWSKKKKWCAQNKIYADN